MCVRRCLLVLDYQVDFCFSSLFSPGKSIAVSSILLALVLVGRAAFVFPLSFLTNLTKKSPSDKISLKQQVKVYLFFFPVVSFGIDSLNQMIYYTSQ